MRFVAQRAVAATLTTLPTTSTTVPPAFWAQSFHGEYEVLREENGVEFATSEGSVRKVVVRL